MKNYRIIGLSGTNGAGKDAVADILVRYYGFLFAGATEMLVDELRNRQWPTDRTHKSALSAEWRRQYGMAVIVDKAIELYEASQNKHAGLVVGSLRHPGEADRIHELGGTVIWLDADPKVRYERIRTAHRGRDAEDDVTFEVFLADEAREMNPSGDAATLNMAAVKERADMTIINNSADLAVLRRDLEAALQLS